MADPRKTADLVLGLVGSGEGKTEDEAPASPMEPVDPVAEAKRAAAGDAMAAFKSGDVDGLEAALTAFVRACKDEGYEDEEG